MKIHLPFSLSNVATADLTAEYNAKYKSLKRGEISRLDRIRIGRVKKEIDRRLQIIEVTPEEKNNDLIEQLAGNDAVHEFGAETPERLAEMRLGGRDSTKTAYALIDPISRDIYAAIYVYRSEIVKTEGMGNADIVASHVGEVLHEKPRDLQGMPTALTFYSITRFFKMNGEGELLISKLHERLNQELQERYGPSSDQTVFSTLSPARFLSSWIDYHAISIDPADKDELENIALRYITDKHSDLPKGVEDLVRRFHLSNGAEILAIRPDANFPGSEDVKKGFGVMINYGYPRNPYDLKRNALAFSSGVPNFSNNFNGPSV